MQILEVQGGIGNQLFQLAGALYLNGSDWSDLVYNTSYAKVVKHRPFLLDKIGFDAQHLSFFHWPEWALGLPGISQTWSQLYQHTPIFPYKIITEQNPYRFEAGLAAAYQRQPIY